MKSIIHLGLLASLLAISSCFERDDDIETDPINPNPEVEVPPCQTIEVKDNITTPTVWKAGNVYVIKDRSITINGTSLTIEAGVIVKAKNASLKVSNGTILANGTSDKRIVFTSLADDRYCGDTNGDKTTTTSSKGDWQGLNIAGGTGHIFRNVDILYAGQERGGYYNAVKLENDISSFEFDNCRIAYTLYSAAASYDNASAFYAGSSMKDASRHRFTNNSLYENGKPIFLWTHYTLNINNRFHNPDNPSQKNSHNGIFMIRTSGGLDTSVNWHINEVPYVLDEFIQVHSGQRVSVGPNVVVKFKGTGDGIAFATPNQLVINATALFTSYKDDSIGGDTNGDGTQSFPKTPEWRGLYEINQGKYLSGAFVRYAQYPIVIN